jgi:hypothetical protein
VVGVKKSNHKKGYCRNNAIVTEIAKNTALNTDQLKLLFFQDVSNQMACRVLSRMVEDKKVLKRDRLSMSEPYFYYTDKKPGQIEHVLGMSWVYVWLKSNLHSWEQLHSFQREIDYRILRADGFAAIKNVWTNKYRFLFLEMDIAKSGNKFDKVSKYNTFYTNEGYLGAWWVPLTERFPPVMIVTTGRKERIQGIVKAENANGLEFQVFTLEEIKRGCSLWHRQQHKHSGQIVRDL